jgi:hypothetical protein
MRGEEFFGRRIWAHFLRRMTPQKTGLSAPIPQPLRGLRDFRCNPLRAHGLAPAEKQAAGIACGNPRA